MYFDQRARACSCIRMAENDNKTIENHRKSTFSIMRTRGSCKALEEKGYYTTKVNNNTIKLNVHTTWYCI